MRRIAILFVCCIYSFTLFAQDQHFTQFYASPLTLNPALTGAFDGKFRIAFIYRDQWRNVLDRPYVTYSAGMDLRFNVRYPGKNIRDGVGVGMLFYSDVNSGVDFNTNIIALSGAYHKALSKKDNQFLCYPSLPVH